MGNRLLLELGTGREDQGQKGRTRGKTVSRAGKGELLLDPKCPTFRGESQNRKETAAAPEPGAEPGRPPTRQIRPRIPHNSWALTPVSPSPHFHRQSGGQREGEDSGRSLLPQPRQLSGSNQRLRSAREQTRTQTFTISQKALSLRLPLPPGGDSAPAPTTGGCGHPPPLQLKSDDTGDFFLTPREWRFEVQESLLPAPSQAGHLRN